jgi:hypothetical protein
MAQETKVTENTTNNEEVKAPQQENAEQQNENNAAPEPVNEPEEEVEKEVKHPKLVKAWETTKKVGKIVAIGVGGYGIYKLGERFGFIKGKSAGQAEAIQMMNPTTAELPGPTDTVDADPVVDPVTETETIEF